MDDHTKAKSIASYEDGGHGALSRHVAVDDSILPLWLAFEEILRSAAPALAHDTKTAAAE